MKGFRRVLAVCVVLFVSGCGSMASQKLFLTQDASFKQYDKIRNIVIEEAANNGFSQLTSEVRPSEYNNWVGELYFKTETIYGTDQFTVEFEKAEEGISVYIHGAGMKANAESAAKAIQARLDKEGLCKGVESRTANKQSQPGAISSSPATPKTAQTVSGGQESQLGDYLITIKNSNIRTGPTAKSQIITTLKKGAKIEKIGESRDWYKVKLLSGETGHIYKPLAEDIQKPETSSHAQMAPPQTTKISTQVEIQTPQANKKVTSNKAIPPDCPLAKIEEGMGEREVKAILGPPQDEEAYVTGKAWIPFYTGGDSARVVYYYKGLGQIHCSYRSGRVVHIIYDPSEDGFR